MNTSKPMLPERAALRRALTIVLADDWGQPGHLRQANKHGERQAKLKAEQTTEEEQPHEHA